MRHTLVLILALGCSGPGPRAAHAQTVDVRDARPSLAIEPVQPNPSRGDRLRVWFSLPNVAPARIELLDVSGRRVLERTVDSPGPGRHALEITAGRRLPAGIYLVRLTQGGNERVTRVAIVK